jgi:hypothetical protein
VRAVAGGVDAGPLKQASSTAISDRGYNFGLCSRPIGLKLSQVFFRPAAKSMQGLNQSPAQSGQRIFYFRCLRRPCAASTATAWCNAPFIPSCHRDQIALARSKSFELAGLPRRRAIATRERHRCCRSCWSLFEFECNRASGNKLDHVPVRRASARSRSR